MKKRIISAIIILTVLCSFPLSVKAQSPYGIAEAGITASSIRGDSTRELPAYYNAYREDYMLEWYMAGLEGKQNQLSTSACWAFVQNELLCANLAKKTGKIYDFSEETMKFETSYLTDEKWGYYRTPNEGGNEIISTAFLARTGSVLESDEPFTELSERTVDPSKLDRYGYLDHTLFFECVPYDPDRYGLPHAEIITMQAQKREAIQKIKELVTDYGAVGAGVYYEGTTTYEDKNKECYNYTGIAGNPNHSVTIIGWDDNYSADKFKKKPEGDGAFIVKNSWGKYHNGGKTGYFYVSYYDKFITSQFFVTDYEMENEIYDNVYQYDGYGWAQNGYVRGQEALCVSTFHANKLSEKLSAVSTYVTEGGQTVEILVNVSGDINDASAYKTVSKKTYDNAGYYLIDFEPIPLESSEYYVAVKITGQSELTYFAMQGKIGNFIPNAQNTPNTCFIGTDFTNLTPIERIYRNNEAMHCIKAFTQSEPDETEPSGKVFFDVRKGKWYYDEIEYCVSHGLFSGMSKNFFEPDTAMSRAMFITVLANLSGEKIEKGTHPFSDVKSGKWYTDEIAWGYKNGIVSGITKTTFEPDTNITREQMCFMLLKFCQYKGIKLRESVAEKTFTDSSFIRTYAKDAVKLCQRAGIISGMTDGSFAPRKNATRAEVAVLVTGLAKNYIY